MKHFFIAYAIMWIAVSAAVIAGLYFTRSANCLWAFLLPACVGYSRKISDTDTDKSSFEDEED